MVRIRKATVLKYLGTIVIGSALLSTVVFIAHQCHSDSVASGGPSHQASIQGDTTASASTNSIAVGKVCAALFFIVFLIGRKHIVRIARILNQALIPDLRQKVFLLIRPPNLTHALSFLELGVVRI